MNNIPDEVIEGWKGEKPQVKIGMGCKFSNSVRIRCKKFTCGNNGVFHDRVTIIGDEVTIGDNFWIGQDSILDGTGKLNIENDVAIGAGTYIFTHMGRNGKILLSRRVTIKKGAWLLPKVFINPGVTIGENARIDNCSLVTKDIPSNSIARGSPAKIIKKERN